MILRRLDHEHFLRHHWQQQPLLIRHDGEPFVDPLEPDELAGLACEDHMESRLVSCLANESWQVRHGPFDPAMFADLGDRDWTLLVQAVDQVLAPVEDLKRAFDFLPAWRLDDVMISFATDGGGVGPHYDNYDVFLVQGLGSRLWRIGQRCDHQTSLRRDSGLKLLENFEPEAEHQLYPGDVLYLPPGIAHQGISTGNSLCYSIGFRAPSCAEALQAFAERLSAGFTEDQRFRDTHLNGSNAASELKIDEIADFYRYIKEYTANIEAFSNSFACLVSEPRYPERIQSRSRPFTLKSLTEKLNKVSQPYVIYKNPASRFFWRQGSDQLWLYVDGEPILCEPGQRNAIKHLCQTAWNQPLDCRLLTGTRGTPELLVALLNQGSLVLERPST